MRTAAGLLVGIIISVLCLWFAFKDVDVQALANSLEHVGWGWVASSILLVYLGLVIRSLRWRYLLPMAPDIRFMNLLAATFIGMMANNILPARIGEVVRAWVLSRRERVSVPEALGSIVLERLLDVIAALAILGVCVAFSPDLGDQASRLRKQAGTFVFALALGVIVLLVVLSRRRDSILQWGQKWSAKRAAGWARRSMDGLHKFALGLDAVRGGRQVATLAALSLLTWAIAIASFQMIAEGLALRVSPMQMSLVFVIVLFGVAIPSAPGFVGTFHGFCVAGLTLVVGMEPTPAATFATIVHGAQWLSVTVVGLLFLLVDRSLSWAELTHISSLKPAERAGD